MKRKITLVIDEDYIRAAKEYAKREGKSVSQLLEEYFAKYGEPIKPLRKEEMSPLVRSLTGSLKGALKSDGIKNYREVYDDYLEERYP